MKLTTTQLLVKGVLENALAPNFKWSLQGMGLLRLYLDPNVRLHIWDKRFRAPGVSMIHDHLQWDLSSEIVFGMLRNRRYHFDERRMGGSQPYHYRTLRAGVGCEFVEPQKDCWLREKQVEIYHPGQSYHQFAKEVHETDAVDSTITIMTKTPQNNELANVFWPMGTVWGSAEPRPATEDEIRQITGVALDKVYELARR